MLLFSGNTVLAITLLFYLRLTVEWVVKFFEVKGKLSSLIYR